MKKYYKRLFLNKLPGVASLEIDFDGYYGNIKISDCNRAVALSLDISNPKEKTNSKYKVDTLISELVKFKTKLDKE